MQKIDILDVLFVTALVTLDQTGQSLFGCNVHEVRSN